MVRSFCVGLSSLITMLLPLSPAEAQKSYDVGANDAEIRIGNIMPYSGPASAFGVIGKTEAAYFDKINSEGGINGRKIKFISYDDAYSPPKAVEQVRKLVEQDEVLLIFNPLGTPSNSAIQKYLNQSKVPQIFIASGATKWGDPEHFPWTMGWIPTYQAEGRAYASFILQNKPDGKIGVLYQNDDFGKDYLKGLRDGLANKAEAMIVAAESYEVSEPTIDSHIVKLKAAGVDTVFYVTTPKFSAQAIKKVAEMGWKPLQFLNGTSFSVASTIKPAGIENAQGIISSTYGMDPTDQQWKEEPAMKEWLDFMDKWNPKGDKTDASNLFAYNVARTLVQVLRQCGDDLTRANVMKQAANLKDYQSGTLLPGVKIDTSPTDFFPLEQLQLMRFEGESWKLFGPIKDVKLPGK
jgi:branched-chain amino acid transport system substrate-binding protein